MFKELGVIPKLCRNCKARKLTILNSRNEKSLGDKPEQESMVYPELQLNTRLWQGKTTQEIQADLSSALLEFQRQPNIYWTTPEQLKKIAIGVRKDNLIFENEAQALEETIAWSEFGETPYSIWVSPLKEGIYPCSRVVVSRRYEELGKVKILNVAVCLPLSISQCLRVFDTFMQYSSQFITPVDSEDLRKYPVHFTLPKERSFPELVKILSGKDIPTLFIEKEQAEKDAGEITTQYYDVVQSTLSKVGHIYIGYKIEQEALARNYQINKFRDCPGISNTEALKQIGAFDAVYNGPPALENKLMDSKKFDTQRTCASCGEYTYVWAKEKGGCDVCQKCNIEYDLGIRK